MAREIKFRAWDEKLSIMTTPFIDFLIFEESDTFKKGQVLHQHFEDDDFIPTHVMQFTGLKDVKGVDIYESDIVRYCGFYEGDYYENEGIGFIDWDEEGHAVCKVYENGEVGYVMSTWDFAKNNGGVVVGNIYENPELLK